MKEDIRWIQRFDNFSKAFVLLREILDSTDDICSLESIVKEGIIQRFEYTFELAWKTLKDKMIDDGLNIDKVSPKYVFKTAYQSKYIDRIEDWIDMTNDRNIMSHTYDFLKLDPLLIRLKNAYYPCLDELFMYFLDERNSI